MELKKIVVILGPPGSGKGTQGKLLAPILNFAYLSMGQFLREYGELDRPMSRKIKDMIDGGNMITTEMLKEIFDDVLLRIKDSKGVVFDGFPRKLDQVPFFEKIVEDNGIQDVKVISLEVPEEKLLQRIHGRDQGRADDDPSIIKTRFDLYQEKTLPINDYFEKKGLLIKVNGDQPVEDVHKEILNKLGLKS